MRRNADRSVLIVYHSMTGGASQMATAAAQGAMSVEGISLERMPVRLLRAMEAGPAEVLAAGAFIFVTPENLAAISGHMKDFFDRTYYAALDRLEGLPYASMICAGSDGSNAARQIARIATGWRLKAVAEPLIVCTRAQTTAEILSPKAIGADDLARCHSLGATLAAGASMGIY